jgi:acyl dehydratase
VGRYLEEFTVGDVFITPEREITQGDIQAFADLTGDHNPVHVDKAFASQGIYGRLISHGPMMIGITFGLLSKLDLLDGTIIALKAVNWSFDAPIHPGDRVHVRAIVDEARSSGKARDRGVLVLTVEVLNQADLVVQKGQVAGVMKKRVAASSD